MQKLRILLAILVCLCFNLVSLHPLSAQPSASDALQNESVLVDLVKTPFKEDLDQMRQRRMIRVLVNYSRTRFFYDHGRARGFEYELLKAYEKSLNKGVKHHQWVKLIFVPVPFDQLLTALQNG